MNKILLLIAISILAAIVMIGGVILIKDGYLFVGDVWFDTVEEALNYAADNPTNDKRTLTVKELIDKRKIGDTVQIAFVSEDDSFVEVTCVTNEKGQYSVYGYTEEGPLESPSEFVLDGDKDQFILFPYFEHGSTVFGWCYSSVTPIVSGITPSFETFEFECQEKTWSLNFWWIDDFPTECEVEIKYADKK